MIRFWRRTDDWCNQGRMIDKIHEILMVEGEEWEKMQARVLQFRLLAAPEESLREKCE